MNFKIEIKNFGLFILIGYATTVSTDSCSSLTTCKDCLTTRATTTQCGWCHLPVVYHNGTGGSNCVDPFAPSPFRCLDMFDTYKCTRGWKCIDH